MTDDALTESAGRIADGLEVDWERLRRESPEATSRLEALTQLERLAGAWRAAGAVPDDRAAEPALFAWGELEARERLGEGSFGEVYRAFDPALRREVALKLRRADASESGTRRALDEARHLARVRHPNVIAIHGADVHDGRVGFWTDLVLGRTLDQDLAERGPFGAREAALVGCDLCRALAAVHAAGLVHGDVKGANVLREHGGRIVLADFGSGRDAASAGGGAVATSPLAAAPELLRGDPPSVASDLYALGALLFRLASGRHPYEAATLDELRAKHERGERASLRALRPDLPTSFVAAVERALQAAPADRFADAGAFELALESSLAAPSGVSAGAPAAPRRSHARLRAGLAAAAALVAVVLAGLALRRFGANETPASPPLAAVVLAGLALRRFGANETRETPASPPLAAGERAGDAGAAAPAPPAANLAPLAPPGAHVTLWRGRDGVRTPLADGDAVRPGDHLWLEYRGDEPLHVYVLDEDDRGETFALFPVRGTDVANPLPARRAARLPGSRDGAPFDWVVTSAGGHERLLVVASRVPLAALEDLLAAVPAAEAGAPVAYAGVPEGALLALRGIGGMAPSAADARDGRLAAVERALESQRSAGYWVRHFVLHAP